MEAPDSEADMALRRELSGRVVLLLEDDAVFAQPIVRHLEHYGVAQVDLFATGEAARDAALARRYDVLLLDRQNPGMEGLKVLQVIRQTVGPSQEAPVLMITQMTERAQRSKGMLLGADDYVEKPVEELELLARIVARMRRSGPVWPIVNGPLVIDGPANRATLGGEVLSVTSKEFKILSLLARSAGLPVTHSMVFTHCWENQSLNTTGWQNTVAVNIHRLKKKLEAQEHLHLHDDARPMIVNVKGTGYLLRDLSRVVDPNPAAV